MSIEEWKSMWNEEEHERKSMWKCQNEGSMLGLLDTWMLSYRLQNAVSQNID